MKPGISVQRFFSLTEERGLSAKEVLIAGHWRGKVITTSSDLLTLLVLLCHAITSARLGGGGGGC
jgi:hypothetical protein